MRTRENDKPRAVLERIAQMYKDESTREFLLGMARRGVRSHDAETEVSGDAADEAVAMSPSVEECVSD
jgi:hypothetical protein